jgi:hypothetical protein
MSSQFSVYFDDFNENLSKVSSLKSFDSLLQLLYGYANLAVTSGQWKGRAVFLPQIDQALINLIEHEVVQDFIVNLTESNNESLIIATEIYASGGHGKILNQILEREKSHVIFTDIFNNITDGKLKLDKLVIDKKISCSVLIGASLQMKFNSLMGLINSIKPKFIYLLGHHQDVVTQLAGVVYAEGQRTIYVHHCDHDPAIGATINYQHHLDFTQELSNICSHYHTNNSIIPLTVAPYSNAHLNIISEKIKFATCGTPNKFSGALNGINYIDLIIKVLSSNQNIDFYHIGAIDEQAINFIRSSLEANDISPSRFFPVGQVGSLQKFLVEKNINFYISSFPIGGGTSAMEAQSLGIPVIYANPDFYSLPLTAIRSVYGSNELEWSTLDEITNIVAMAVENLGAFSKLAHVCYLNKSHPKNIHSLISYINGDL